VAWASGGVGIMGKLSPEVVRAWVERSCAQQQVPVTVSDPVTLARIGVLLGRGGSAAPGGGAAARTSLGPPDRRHAVGIEPSGTFSGVGGDDAVVEDRADDGALPVEVEL
jgi:hypothetical protein